MPFYVNNTIYWDGDIKIHSGTHARGAGDRHGPFATEEEAVFAAVSLSARHRKGMGLCDSCRIPIPVSPPRSPHCTRCSWTT